MIFWVYLLSKRDVVLLVYKIFSCKNGIVGISEDSSSGYILIILSVYDRNDKSRNVRVSEEQPEDIATIDT